MVNKIVKQIIECFNNGNKLLIIGNGGSSAEAQHMAGELVGRFYFVRRALPAIALTTDTSIITSISNDDAFINIFSRQVEALGKKGDILLTLSTSGKSENIIKAQITANEMGLVVIDLPRKGNDTPEIQENHLKMIHLICKEVEEAFI